MQLVYFALRVTKNVLAALKRNKFKMALELIEFRFLQPLGIVRNRLNYQALQELAPHIERDGCDYLERVPDKNIKNVEQYLINGNFIPDLFSNIINIMVTNREIVRDYPMPISALKFFFNDHELHILLKSLETERPAKVYSNVRISIFNKDQTESDDKELAQEFHRDFDYPSFIKVFCYLNDVAEGCGQHEFYLNSQHKFNHLIDARPRVAGADIEKSFSDVTLHKQMGPAGTRFIANTVGYHRGTRITKPGGYRIFAMFTFAKGYSEWGNEVEY